MRPLGISRLGSVKRRTLTLLCFMMAISLVGSVSIFVDSMSLEKWNEFNDIGPVAMQVQGENLDTIIEDINNINHISHASIVNTAHAYLRMDKNTIYTGSPDDPLNPMFLLVGQAYSINDDFSAAFPTEFELTVGRYPQNSSEIAIPEEDAAYWGIPIGRMMNYSHFLNSEKHTVFVVGFFKSSEDAIRSVITDAIAIVTSDVLNPETIKTRAYIDIERDCVSPWNPKNSLSILREIETDIIASNPSDSIYNQYLIDNYLAVGIQSYISYLNGERGRQLTRVQSLILLAGLFSFLGSRFNLLMREEELSMLKARGATQLRITREEIIELWGTSFFSVIFGILVAIGLSKIAMISSGFLTFNYEKLTNSPLLITIDTLMLLFVVSIILPIFGYVIHHMVQRFGERDIEYGRLARLTKAIRLIRWDISLILIVCILLAGVYLGGGAFSENPVLSFIIGFSTIPVFLAIASIFNKTWYSLSKPISNVVSRGIGKIPSNLGIRGVSKNNLLSFPVILIIAIAISTNLTSNVIASSLPNTQLVHSRFVIGGDLSFHLENNQIQDWDNFSIYVKSRQGVIDSSLVSVGKLALSDGPSGVFEFIAIDPEEYIEIGYSFTGVPLDSSAQKSKLNDLELNPEGVILTSDIASEYDLLPGDTLRIFSFGDESGTYEFNILDTVQAIPRPITSGQPTSDQVVGTRKIWLNRDYIETLVHLNESSDNFLCVRIDENTNSTSIGLEILEYFGSDILSFNEWSSSSADVDSYLSQEQYMRDRALDTMISISMISSVLVAIIAYQTAQRVKRRNEYALVKSLGGSDKQIIQIRFAESLGLIVLSLFIVLLFGPIDLANLLRVNYIRYQVWTYVFPISIFSILEWNSYLLLMGLVIIPSLFLVFILSKRNRIIDIGGTLREMFQEGNMEEYG